MCEAQETLEQRGLCASGALSLSLLTGMCVLPRSIQKYQLHHLVWSQLELDSSEVTVMCIAKQATNLQTSVSCETKGARGASLAF